MSTAILRMALWAALLLLGALPAAAQPAPVPGFKDCPECPEMVAIPPGTFTLGDAAGVASEQPVRAVLIRKKLAFSRTEITWDQWLACVEGGGCTRLPDDHKWGKGNRPIINITWEDATAFAAWLAKRTGKPYRLPSEAEWEYAGKAGTATRFWWGGEAGKMMANCRFCGSPFDGKESAPVASFPANPWGLHDMNGNIWEWVGDCWNPNHAGASAGGGVREDGNCDRRVVKSGSWYYIARLMGAASRDSFPRDQFSYNIGIRVIREME